MQRSLLLEMIEIEESAKGLNDIRASIETDSMKIFNQLIKLYYFKSPDTYEHWIANLHAAVKKILSSLEIYKRKHSVKYFTDQDMNRLIGVGTSLYSATAIKKAVKDAASGKYRTYGSEKRIAFTDESIVENEIESIMREYSRNFVAQIRRSYDEDDELPLPLQLQSIITTVDAFHLRDILNV